MEVCMDIWKELLRQAYVEATKSPDPSTQNGALVVSRIGDNVVILGAYHNRFPHGVISSDERWNDRALKYKLVHHAERSTLGTARRAHNVPHFDGLTMVCPWAACTECAQEIIDEGIRTLIIHKQAHDRTPPESVWSADIVIAHMMLREAGVSIIEYDGIVGGPSILHSGKYWNP